jgi:hypothetical protein
MSWLWLLAGLAMLGWLVTHLRLRHMLEDRARARTHLTELETQVARLRHDLRGILSPALLTADRLLEHPEPSVRRAGEVVVRTVDRATARLAETKLAQTHPHKA